MTGSGRGEIARFAAGLAEQAHALDRHVFIECLCHVIDCQEGDRSGCKCFHFYARFGVGGAGGIGGDGGGLDREIERHAGERQRSEEHTSELQSLMRISYAVFCLKKKTILNAYTTISANKNNTHSITSIHSITY